MQFLKFLSLTILGVFALLASTYSMANERPDIVKIVDLSRVITPYNPTDWQFCKEGMYISGGRVLIDSTPLSGTNKTIRQIFFQCTTPDFVANSHDAAEKKSIIGFSGEFLTLHNIDTEAASQDCPRNVFPTNSQSHAAGFKPGASGSPRIGYSALGMKCDDTSKNYLEMYGPNQGKIYWHNIHSCPSKSAACGVALYIGDATTERDAAISGMSIACCRKSD
jgi:hypothetical protein